MSSTKGLYRSSKAVDGDLNGDLKAGGSCMHSGLGPNPWWAADLGKTKTVARMVFVNRADCCQGTVNIL